MPECGVGGKREEPVVEAQREDRALGRAKLSVWLELGVQREG